MRLGRAISLILHKTKIQVTMKMLKLVHLHYSHSFQLQPLASLKTTQKSRSAAAIPSKQLSLAPSFCSCCGRRHFIEAATAAFLPISSSKSNASSSHSDHYLVPSKLVDYLLSFKTFNRDYFDVQDLLNRIHPPRPDWYEEFYASVMDTSMKPYEAKVSNYFMPFVSYTYICTIELPILLLNLKIAGYKSQLFEKLKGKAKRVLEIGIGTGPNLEYYAGDNEVQVFGLDPNKKMEKYARAAATAVGLPSKDFHFIEAVSCFSPSSSSKL